MFKKNNISFGLTICFLFLTCSFSALAQQSKSQKTVKKILFQQADNWNKGDIDAFMQDYWQSAELQFVGSKGVTFGWQQTLENYKNAYPDTQAMGKLDFEIIRNTQLSKKVILMTGKFMLERQQLEDLSGHFLLVWKKIKGQWVIVADHTS